MMKHIGINDFAYYNYPTCMSVSPDGKHGVIPVVNVNMEDNCYDSCLWVMDMESGEYKKLTNGKKERNFIWLDSETVLFVSNREKSYAEKIKNGEDWTCFYKINVNGGEAEFAFAVPRKVAKMKLAGDKLVMTVKYDYNKPNFALMADDEKKEAMKAWNDEKDYEVFDELPFWANGQGIVNKMRARLCIYDMKTGEDKIVSADYENVEAFWVEGDKVLYVGNLYTDKKDLYQSLKCYDLNADSVETLVEQKDMKVDYACILGGKVLFFGSDMKMYGCNENCKLYTVENGKISLVSDYDDSVHNTMGCDCKFADGTDALHDDKCMYFLATTRKNTVLRSFDAEGHMKTLIDRQGIIGNIAKHGDMFYFSGMRDMGISEIYSFDGKEEKKLTSFNDELMAERAVCPVEEFTFYHKDIELDGYVIKPLDYDPNKSYPGLLTIHGGPRAVFGPVYFHE
ncbi:MAG: hypothetical protein IJO13_10790, partial [Lachnospiraceae bacterium]|nr:hypothetical protein [Lachnospiraceae bacterium]